ncbi:GNAT family N-acetyltransferase [Streptomyces sp. NPDC087850]|uniref:GNAT family N-acetyltransferase n=1 Tax=unclassified Streptomyces TaxID=2593676 RepID=UPI003825539D
MTEPLVTERLTLVPLRVDHAEEMAAVLADPGLHTFIGGKPSTVEELRSRYARMVAGSTVPAISWCNWVIALREEDPRRNPGRRPERRPRLVGYVQATIAPRRGDGRLVAEVAWVVGTEWQGRGIAKEAAWGLVGWLEGRGIRALRAHIHPDHRASAAVARSLGLEPTEEWHDGEVRWHRQT